MAKGMMGFRRIGRDNLRHLRSEGDDGMRRRDWPKAIKFYQDYLDHRPDDAAILVQLGHALKEMQQSSAAKMAYSKAVAAAPNDSDAQFHLENLLRTLEQLGEMPIAKGTESHTQDVVITKLLRTEDSYNNIKSPSYNFLADRERDCKNWRVAAVFYSEHLKHHIDDAAIWVQLGHMLKESGFFEEAIYAYSVAKRMEQQPSDVSIHLANLLAQVGRASDAKPLWAEMFQSQKTFFLANT